MKLRSNRYIGETTFPMQPEILEMISTHLDSDTLSGMRLVCKEWNDELSRVLGRRGFHTFGWGNSEYNVETIRTILRTTMNPQLFTSCYVTSSYYFRNARTLFIEFGINLRTVELKLDVTFPIRHHQKHLVAFYKLASEWGPNIKWMNISIPVESMTKLPRNGALEEVYEPRYEKGFRTSLEYLEFTGVTAPFFPEFCTDLIKSSPKLETLNFVDLPPPRWRRVYFGISTLSTYNFELLDKFEEVAAVMSRLKNFSWSLTSRMFRGLYFDPINEEDGTELGRRLADINFKGLESLNLDASATLGQSLDSVNHLKRLLSRNTGIRRLNFNTCCQDAPLTIIIGNQMPLVPVVLDVKLPNLTELYLYSVKGKTINLFDTLKYMPNLRVLEVRKKDPNHYLFYVAQSCFFKSQYALDRPHTSLQRLVYEYPFGRIQDVGAVLDSFPALSYFETVMGFGERFLYGPQHILGDVSFTLGSTRLVHVVTSFANKLQKLKTLKIIAYSEIHNLSDWIRVFKMIKRLKGLGEMLIECRCLTRTYFAYPDKINEQVKKIKNPPFPIRVSPITNNNGLGSSFGLVNSSDDEE